MSGNNILLAVKFMTVGCMMGERKSTRFSVFNHAYSTEAFKVILYIMHGMKRKKNGKR